MKSIEDQAEEYAEALNDIADIMDLPTGNSAKDIVEAVHDMRAQLSAFGLCKAENDHLRSALIAFYGAASTSPDMDGTSRIMGLNRVYLDKAYEGAKRLLLPNKGCDDGRA